MPGEQGYTPSGQLVVNHRLTGLADAVGDKLRPSKTEAGYARDWILWQDFLRQMEIPPDVPADRDLLIGFVMWLDKVHRAAPATMTRRITGVRSKLRRKGTPVEAGAAKEVANLIEHFAADPEIARRGRGKAKAATVQDVKAMARIADTSTLVGKRDRALALISFNIAGRSAEVAALRFEGIRLESKGLNVAIPKIKRTPARDAVVGYGSGETCPVHAWLSWKEAAGLAEGPAFQGIDRWGNLSGRHMAPESCARIIKKLSSLAETPLYTGHSMRSGYITETRKAGKREEKIRAVSGHSPKSHIFWGYIQEADKWEDAAGVDLGF
ncbi:hypothetical protein ABT282_07490 [Streptomyces sp. NPDC000927]|uniref:hypothetical protein n=1 Tax=Streptomyces sp. NPDC000927 TaxID=3154371 RepID=UPI0033178A1C